AARISVILLPFAGLPWMIAFTIRAIRRGGWRDPALFALTVLTVGGVNATALVFAGIGPLLWFPFAVWGSRETTLPNAVRVFARIGALTLLTSLWWISGLLTQGGYGIEILRYTETAKVVAAASVAPEVLRGLGYWFFYGSDRLGPWIEPSVDYTQRLWLIAVTYLTPVLALLGATITRWKHRAYFAVLVFAGVFIAVGAHPWDDPPLTGDWWKSLLLSDRGLALRSTPRAVPLVALGLAVFLATGLTALGRAMPRLVRPLGAGLVVLTILGLPPLFTGGMVASNLQRPENLPGYWTDATRAFDDAAHTTRVFEVPGSDFASYRWGNTVDPITPGLMDRPYVARELIPYGSPASADLLNAVDRRIQENILEPQAVAPLARMMAAGDVVARNDLQYERFRLARPYQVMPLLGAAPGLGAPVAYGTPTINAASPTAPLIDEAALRDDTQHPYGPVVDFPVNDPQNIVRTTSAQAPVLVDGDGEGLVSLASAGLLDGRELVQYAASYAKNTAGLQAQLDRGAALVVTDSNRRRARRWSTLRDNLGYTEQAGETPLRQDLTDNRLPVFPDANDDSYSVALYPGGVSAQATTYGNSITYTPEYRPANAVDGDLRTAWKTGASSDVRGEKLVLSFAQPVTTDHVTVTQLLSGVRNRSITKLDLRFDDGDTMPFDLDATSSTLLGQALAFPERTFSKLELIIRDDDTGRQSTLTHPVRYSEFSPVGFSEVNVNDIHGAELVRMPTDLLAAAGDASASHPLTLAMERLRTDGAEVVRDDEETAIARQWSLPTARTFALTGEARLSQRVGDDLTDLLLGVVGPTATSSRHLGGDLDARSSSAIDGDPTTAWVPGFAEGNDDSITYQLGRPLTFDHMDLMVVADGRHSVPTHMRIEADGRTVANVTVPAVTDRPGAQGADAVVRVPIDLRDAVTGTKLTFVVDGLRDVTTTDWFSSAPIRMPVGIAELGIDGLSAGTPDQPVDTGCRTDLLTIDDLPVGVEITGSLDDARHGRPLKVTLCGSDEPGVTLGPGDHVLRAAKGLDSGLDLDRLVLQSDGSGNAPTTITPPGAAQPSAPVPQVTRSAATDYDITVTNPKPGTPFWLVLGQSHNDGWSATADGKSLGKPQLVDGYANGWLINTPSATVKVHLEWTPQRLVWICLFLSLLGAILCLILAIRRPRAALDSTIDDPPPDAFAWRTFVRFDGRDVPALRTALAMAAIAGVLTAAVVGPIAGAVTAVAALWAGRRHRARWLLAIGAPALLALAGSYVIGRQAHYQPTAAFEWPGELAAVHQIGWLAVVFLLTLVAADWAWERVNRRRRAVADAAASARIDDVSPSVDAPDSPP
ncbi:MAG TPA: alpha-(1-_3)-arabinofuranosyltransferase family protein, partial [Acidimicrobiales bacterium]|nr:alpha-(1->3)-arabinofuranosyltransferase family protein [Acidimicrobiales bacterium]